MSPFIVFLKAILKCSLKNIHQFLFAIFECNLKHKKGLFFISVVINLNIVLDLIEKYYGLC